MALEAQNNPFTSVLMVEAADVEALPDADPSAGSQRLAVGTDHLLYLVNSSGVKTAVGAPGAVATDAIWDAKGDLAGGTGANTAAKLTVGSNDTILMADSGQSTGLKWVASQTPSTQAFGDAAAEGTADTYARGDHKHAMPASPASALLAVALINNTTSYTTTSSTQADTHSSVAVTFTAPASGNVLVRVTCGIRMDNTNNNAFLGLRESTTNVVDKDFAIQGQTAMIQECLVSKTFYVTGVSAGSHTYKLAFAVNGGATFTVRANNGVPVLLEVWSN
jgi:hypothetical protein